MVIAPATAAHRRNRPHSLTVPLVLTLLLGGTSLALAQAPAEKAPAKAPTKISRETEVNGREWVTPDAQRAIDNGLAFLVSRQYPDGAFGTGEGYKRNVAVTALSGMSLLSAGHMPGRGKYGANVEKAVDFIVDSSDPSGYLFREEGKGHGPMYSHGFATLFLAEAYGMSPRKDVRDKLKGAVQLIVDRQNKEGGWRYEPNSSDADISATVCQIMALRAARNCGIAVPKQTVDLCTDYVRKCQNHDGGFRYMSHTASPSAFPRSAAGVVCLYSAGVYDDPDIRRGLNYLERFQLHGDLLRFEQHYFYGQYYATQAMWQAGGEHWRNWYPNVRDELIRRQLPDGDWMENSPPINREFATAMACLILQMPNNYLPIFQR